MTVLQGADGEGAGAGRCVLSLDVGGMIGRVTCLSRNLRQFNFEMQNKTKKKKLENIFY